MRPDGHATVDQRALLRVALRPKVRPSQKAIVDVPGLHQSRSCHLRVLLVSSASCYPGARAQQGHPGPGSTWPALRTPHFVASTSGSSPPQAPQAARAPNATSQQVGGGLPHTPPRCSPFGDANGVQLPEQRHTSNPHILIRAGEGASSISRAGGTPAWLWNLRPGSTGRPHTLERARPPSSPAK